LQAADRQSAQGASRIGREVTGAARNRKMASILLAATLLKEEIIECVMGILMMPIVNM
jgi:hypothetical protein